MTRFQLPLNPQRCVSPGPLTLWCGSLILTGPSVEHTFFQSHWTAPSPPPGSLPQCLLTWGASSPRSCPAGLFHAEDPWHVETEEAGWYGWCEQRSAGATSQRICFCPKYRETMHANCSAVTPQQSAKTIHSLESHFDNQDLNITYVAVNNGEWLLVKKTLDVISALIMSFFLRWGALAGLTQFPYWNKWRMH